MLHGECKTPGGKLVIVDFSIADSKITDIRIHGDFFIDPEPQTVSVLSALAEAVKGLPINTEPAAISTRFRSAIPPGVELLGTSPEAITVAIRRAIDGDDFRGEANPLPRIGSFTDAEIDTITERWRLLPWRLLPETPLSPVQNTALDEALTEGVIRGAAPCLRFWRWTHPAVIIGRCQAVSNEVDRDAARRLGIEVVRRMTGGGAMLLQPHGAITYSLYMPETLLEGLTLRASYEVCDAWVIRELRILGIDAHHIPINDIACGEGKIGGAAQARRGGAVLHHTTIAYDMDTQLMLEVLRIGREKLKDKAVSSAAKRVSPLVRQTGLSREAIVQHLFDAFQARFGGTISELNLSEIKEAEKLAREKYAHPDWTLQYEDIDAVRNDP